MTVRCPKYQECEIKGCMHWKEHSPILLKDGYCHEVDTECLNWTVRCATIGLDDVKLERELVTVKGGNDGR